MAQQFSTIEQLFADPVDRLIQDVVKVESTETQYVLTELKEYVVTNALRENFMEVLEEYLDTASKYTEDIGIWISGFFGSGKSHFLKMLGYILANRQVSGIEASEIFLARATDTTLSAQLRNINDRLPTQVILFEIGSSEDKLGDSVTEILYRQLLRHFGYASQDPFIAQLEFELEEEGLLDAFKETFEKEIGRDWERQREKPGQVKNQISKVMHLLKPNLYPSPDSWSNANRDGKVLLTSEHLAKKAVELINAKYPGQRLFFMIDEVGQYVGKSSEKMFDMEKIVEQLGIHGQGKVWAAITAQERLTEVVDNLEGLKVEFAKSQDRFPIKIDLTSENIDEVIHKRVLSKTPEAAKDLEELYQQYSGALIKNSTIQKTSKELHPLNQESFVAAYPFLPYQLPLIQDIFTGIRIRPGASRHIGGSSRTLIKAAQQILADPRISLKDEPIGNLVTLDKVYDAVEDQLDTDIKHDMARIQREYDDFSLAIKVAKAIFLLEQVRYVPRTLQNIAAVLYPRPGSPDIAPEVDKALKELESTAKIRQDEFGYKFLSGREITWNEQKKGILVREGDVRRVQAEFAKQVLKAPVVRYQNVKNFSYSITFENTSLVSQGEITIHCLLPQDAEEAKGRIEEVTPGTMASKAEIYWVAKSDSDLRTALEEYFRSDTMIKENARGKVSEELRTLLSEENRQKERWDGEIKRLMKEAFEGGALIHKGLVGDASKKGNSIESIIQLLVREAIPDVYTKFHLAAIKVNESDIQNLFRSEELSGLPTVFGTSSQGLKLVKRANGENIIDPNAPIAAEVMRYIEEKSQFSNEPITGKMLEAHFTGGEYGWENHAVRLVVATLFRGGYIQAKAEGKTYFDHKTPGATGLFTNIRSFRSTSFAKPMGFTLQERMEARNILTKLFHKPFDHTVDALNRDIREQFTEVQTQLSSEVAKAERHSLPGLDTLKALQQKVKNILGSPEADRIHPLLTAKDELVEEFTFYQKFSKVTTPENVKAIAQTQTFLANQWQALEASLEAEGEHRELAPIADRLASNLGGEHFLNHISQIRTDLHQLGAAYVEFYRQKYEARIKAYQNVLREVEAEYVVKQLDESERAQILQPLRKLAQESGEFDLEECQTSLPPLEQILADADAAGTRRADAIRRAAELAQNPEDEVELVTFHVAQKLPSMMKNQAEVESAIGKLREELLSVIKEGKQILIK